MVCQSFTNNVFVLKSILLAHFPPQCIYHKGQYSYTPLHDRYIIRGPLWLQKKPGWGENLPPFRIPNDSWWPFYPNLNLCPIPIPNHIFLIIPTNHIKLIQPLPDPHTKILLSWLQWNCKQINQSVTRPPKSRRCPPKTHLCSFRKCPKGLVCRWCHEKWIFWDPTITGCSLFFQKVCFWWSLGMFRWFDPCLIWKNLAINLSHFLNSTIKRSCILRLLMGQLSPRQMLKTSKKKIAR